MCGADSCFKRPLRRGGELVSDIRLVNIQRISPETTGARIRRSVGSRWAFGFANVLAVLVLAFWQKLC